MSFEKARQAKTCRAFSFLADRWRDVARFTVISCLVRPQCQCALRRSGVGVGRVGAECAPGAAKAPMLPASSSASIRFMSIPMWALAACGLALPINSDVGTCHALPFVDLDIDTAASGLSVLSAFAYFPSASAGLCWYGYVPLR